MTKKPPKTQDKPNGFYKSLIDSTIDWETLFIENEFVYVSPSCLEVTGYSQKEFIKDKNLISKIIHPEDLKLFQVHLLQSFKKATRRTIVFRIITKNSETKWIEHICQPIFNSKKEFVGTRASNRDITEKKIMEIQDNAFISLLSIINSSESIDSLISSTTKLLKEFIKCDAVGIRLREGLDYPYYETIGFPEQFVRAERYLCDYDHQGNVIKDSKGNPVLECMCGNILCGRYDPSKSFFTENGSFWSNCTTELLASTSEKDRQSRTRNRCNGEGYESVGLFVIQNNNNTFGLLQINSKAKGLFSDSLLSFLERFASNLALALHNKYITINLKENETKLKELNNSKDKLFSIIAHDLKSPLSSISGLSSLISKNISNNNLDKAKLFANRIEESTKTTYKLLENLLEWAVSQQNKTQFKPEYIEMNLFFLELFELLIETANKKEIKIVLEPINNIKVYADPNLLKSIMRNLITNAIKFSYKGGQIVITLIENKTDVTISVTDYGIGMDKETKNKVFMIDSGFTTLGTDNEAGTGLGLALCKEFVNSHNGSIWLESEPGLGSTFSFSLPKQ